MSHFQKYMVEYFGQNYFGYYGLLGQIGPVIFGPHMESYMANPLVRSIYRANPGNWLKSAKKIWLVRFIFPFWKFEKISQKF